MQEAQQQQLREQEDRREEARAEESHSQEEGQPEKTAISIIQTKTEECGHQPQTLSCSSSAASTFVPQTFQQPQQPAPAAKVYTLSLSYIPSYVHIHPGYREKSADLQGTLKLHLRFSNKISR